MSAAEPRGPLASGGATPSAPRGERPGGRALQAPGALYRARTLVLGCGRIGSALTPLSRNQCIELLHLSYDLGVRDFDTADIYGQGDSERFIGEAFRHRRGQVRIASKTGQHLSASQKLASLFKGPLRLLAARRDKVYASIAARRSKALRFDFRAQSVRAGLEGSLRRLGMEQLEIFYLHSPPAEAHPVR